MGHINQALTGYGAISVYGLQIPELLSFGMPKAEFLTLGNYISYLLMMTVVRMAIDVFGRRNLMVWGAIAFAFTLFGGPAGSTVHHIPHLTVDIPGAITLSIATAIFGIGWLATF